MDQEYYHSVCKYCKKIDCHGECVRCNDMDKVITISRHEHYKILSKIKCLKEVASALKAIYGDSQLPRVVKDFYKNQIEKALSNYEGTGKV